MNQVFPWREAPATAFAVIGDPISHSLSPKMQTAALRALGRSETYVAIHVPEGEVAEALDYLKSLGTFGVNVTVPHKLAALEWSREPDELAVFLGAANTLNLQTGKAINTDAGGFEMVVEKLVRPHHLGVTKPKALILGAGGSARSVILALHDQGYDVSLYNRTRSRAETLLADMKVSYVSLLDSPEISDCDLLVNTTSISLKGGGSSASSELGIDFAHGKKGLYALDLSYDKAGNPTPFLWEAAENGYSTQDGRAMLVYQGAMALMWWLKDEGVDINTIIPRMAAAVGIELPTMT
jgi:shikimate dehydrogenase